MTKQKNYISLGAVKAILTQNPPKSGKTVSSKIKEVEEQATGGKQVYCVGARKRSYLDPKTVKYYYVDSSGKSKGRSSVMMSGTCKGTKTSDGKLHTTNIIIANVASSKIRGKGSYSKSPKRPKSPSKTRKVSKKRSKSPKKTRKTSKKRSKSRK